MALANPEATDAPAPSEYRGWVRVGLVRGPQIDVVPCHLWSTNVDEVRWRGRVEPYKSAAIASWNAPVELTFPTGEKAVAIISPLPDPATGGSDRSVSEVLGTGHPPAVLTDPVS